MYININNNFLYRFKEIVEKYPDNIAILEDGTKETTYKELFDNAQKVAAYLRKNCNSQRIGISINKSSEYIVTILGCWYAKKTFVPFDVNLPDERKRFIKENSELNLIFTLEDFELSQKLQEDILEMSSQDLSLTMDFPAYIIYTSGTTGLPKGVLVSHNGIVNLADNQIKAFQVDNNSKYLFYVSINFDASISDISVSLLSGATIIIETAEKLTVASAILDLIEKRQITHMDIPPSLLKLINDKLISKTLKTIVIGGEPCDIETVRKWAGKVNLINVYGPTEATVCTSLNRCTEDWTEPLIGKEISNIEYKICDESLENDLVNESGELLISGIGLALGYVNNKELTDKKFVYINNKKYYRTGDLVKRLDNGDIKFLGRIDRQVKIRGQLVELEEIEAKLNAHSQIAKSCVLKREIFVKGKSNLVAFIQPISKFIDIKEIKKYLNKYLPVYMIPAHFEIIDSMPLTSSGKVNQKKLLSYEITTAKKELNDEILTENEKIILDSFKKVLNTEDLSVDDNFMNLGGDSLDIIEVICICSNFGLEISPEIIMQKETAREIAKALLKSSSSKLHVSDLYSDMKFGNIIEKPLESDVEVKNVLVTGTTGFLGSKLLLNLLKSTKYTFYCLVRAKSDTEGLKRIVQTFKKYGNEFIDSYKERIRIICGDIGEEYLGLSLDIYATLTQIIDIVYHCAAKVNMVLTYEQLKNINLLGTKRILEFCITTKKKQLHYASTLSVFVATDFNQGEVFENDRLDNVKYIYGGYGQTKFAAEKYLLNVPPEICDIYIYRFGLITGDSDTGISAANDFLGMFIRGAQSLHNLPIDESNKLAVDITPIDYAAATMAKISINKSKERIFHIANDNPLFYNQFVQFLKEENIIQDIFPYSDWKSSIDSKKFLTRNEQSCILALCRLNLEKYEAQRYMDLFQATNIKFNNQNTKTINSIPCPCADEKLIKKYINYEIQH